MRYTLALALFGFTTSIAWDIYNIRPWMFIYDLVLVGIYTAWITHHTERKYWPAYQAYHAYNFLKTCPDGHEALTRMEQNFHEFQMDHQKKLEKAKQEVKQKEKADASE